MHEDISFFNKSTFPRIFLVDKALELYPSKTYQKISKKAPMLERGR